MQNERRHHNDDVERIKPREAAGDERSRLTGIVPLIGGGHVEATDNEEGFNRGQASDRLMNDSKLAVKSDDDRRQHKTHVPHRPRTR